MIWFCLLRIGCGSIDRGSFLVARGSISVELIAGGIWKGELGSSL